MDIPVDMLIVVHSVIIYLSALSQFLQTVLYLLSDLLAIVRPKCWPAVAGTRVLAQIVTQPRHAAYSLTSFSHFCKVVVTVSASYDDSYRFLTISLGSKILRLAGSWRMSL